jgi:hypothetical protein
MMGGFVGDKNTTKGSAYCGQRWAAAGKTKGSRGPIPWTGDRSTHRILPAITPQPARPILARQGRLAEI